MPDSKYKFDSESLQYDRIDLSKRQKIFRVILTQLVAAVFFAAIFYIAFSYLFESPKQKNLKIENEKLEEQLVILEERYDQTEKVLFDLQERDDNIYRAIFEAEPPEKDSSITLYDKYENFTDNELCDYNTKELELLLSQIKRKDDTIRAIYEAFEFRQEDFKYIPTIQPLDNKDLKLVPYGFGKKIDPVYKTPSFHYGIDFAAPKGTEVYSTAEGKVTRADEKVRGYGKHIRIDHGNGYETVYAHLSEMIVSVGQEVERGEVIGYVGNTGKSLVSHLHYEVLYYGENLNPVNFLFQELTPAQYNQIVEEAARSGLSLD